jgi:hypothetical protein
LRLVLWKYMCHQICNTIFCRKSKIETHFHTSFWSLYFCT